MARADLLCELIKAGLRKDDMTFRRATQAICAEERTKQHEILANKIEQLLKENPEQTTYTSRNPSMHTINSINSIPKHLFEEKMPEKRLEQLLLPDNVVETCRAIIEEQIRADLLRSYGLEPRNKILLIGPPGNGKTSLAEAIAEALMVPLITVRYDTIIGAYLGETASRLSKLFEYASTRQCVLFFDEFDTIGKERGDQHETGEIKRVVSSLLLQIDSLPSYVVAIAATNHDALLDQAVWRRFQMKLELPKPTRANLEKWFVLFEKRMNFSFGLAPSTLAKKLYGKSYAEAEEFAFSVFRQYILNGPSVKTKNITNPSSIKYREKQVWMTINNGNSLIGSRVEYDYHAVQRGTLQHEIFENNSIEVWDIDESIELKINCRGCASENNPEMLIPYALFATFEMAPDCGVEVYQKVVTKVQTKNAIKTM